VLDAMLRVAVAHQRDAVMITEASRVHPGGRRILYVNPAFTAMTGYAPADAIGKTPQITIGPDSDRKAIAAIQEAIVAHRPVRQEILKYRKDGSTFWAEVDIAPVYRGKARPHYLVCVMRDVTDRRRQADLLRSQSEALTRALSARSEFLANVSHELRTPLNAILGYTSMLEQGSYGNLTPAQRRSLARVTTNGQHLLSLISGILDLSRIDSGKAHVHRSSFDLKELVAQVLVDLEPLVRSSRLSMSMKAGRGRFVIRSDRQKVKQILLNLLSNSLKFTERGWVRVELERSGDGVLISVADSGTGIPLAAQRRIFDDFWQADGLASPPLGGTGLGLAISRRLALMLDGDMTVESIVGKGSRFTLRIPIGWPLSRSETRSKPRSGAAPTAPFRKAKNQAMNPPS
jgi:PAS domain S-box-containing protein